MEIDRAIHQGARYLANQIRPDGMFRYRVNMNPAVEVKPRYNILRHAGALYSLTMYHRWNGQSGAESAMALAAGYLRDIATRPVPGLPHICAVWSDAEVSKSGAVTQAKLGGTGLGLAALACHEAVRPGFMEIEVLRSMGRFLVFMQQESGEFYSKYFPDHRGRDSTLKSLYYPGEAALGLAMLHELDPDPTWLESSILAMRHLARERKGHGDNVPPDHWALLATERVLRGPHLRHRAEIESELLEHAAQICRRMLADQIVDKPSPYCGGFQPAGNTTPTATRLEGMQAALCFLPVSSDAYDAIRKAVSLGVEFLIRAQVQEGPFAGAWPRSIQGENGDLSAGEVSNPRACEIRIDYIQHAISALVQYREHSIVNN